MSFRILLHIHSRTVARLGVAGHNHRRVITSEPSEARSRNMAAIRSRDTKPELFVRRAAHAAGYRYRLHHRGLPGKPDLVFPKYRLAVFVHGCFWHGHVCREARAPKSNLSYWLPKIRRNMSRDRASARRLRRSGWHVVTIRECQLESGVARLLNRLREPEETPN